MLLDSIRIILCVPFSLRCWIVVSHHRAFMRTTEQHDRDTGTTLAGGGRGDTISSTVRYEHGFDAVPAAEARPTLGRFGSEPPTPHPQKKLGHDDSTRFDPSAGVTSERTPSMCVRLGMSSRTRLTSHADRDRNKMQQTVHARRLRIRGVQGGIPQLLMKNKASVVDPCLLFSFCKSVRIFCGLCSSRCLSNHRHRSSYTTT